MPPSKAAKNLSSLLRSAIKTTTPKPDDATLKHFVGSLDTSSSSPTTSAPHIRSPKSRRRMGMGYLSKDISSILCGASTLDAGSSDSIEENDEYVGSVLDTPWFSTLSHSNISLRRKEVSRDRKQKWIFKSTQTHRFDRLVKMCGQKLGTDATIQVFGKLGRETGVKEFNALIGLCIAKARETRYEDVWLQEISKVYKILMLMRERGFKLEEESYGPFLMLLIDMEMVEEFHFFCGAIRDGIRTRYQDLLTTKCCYGLGLIMKLKYKSFVILLLLMMRGTKPTLKVCNLMYGLYKCLAFSTTYYGIFSCYKSDRKKEVLLLLEIVDITKFSSLDNLTNIFGSLGRLSLESCAEKFIRALKGSDTGAENISNFIYSYATSVPNLAVDDVISKFKLLHLELEVVPSSAAYEKLIGHCCNSLKAHVALDIVDQMFEAGLTLSIETFHSILCACEESCDYNLVHRIYSMICHNNLKPNNETFRAMINLRVKMKDFEGAYNMIKDLENMNLMPTAGMYNAIMAGYFREVTSSVSSSVDVDFLLDLLHLNISLQKNMHAGLRVLKQMEDADVKPDSQTFTYLIGNCVHEEAIVKYYEELKCSGVQITKHIFMALINAYAACGQFEKAKKVVLDKGVPVKSLSEIKSVLASALASHGQISEALDVCEEIKEAECNLEPKAIICLMDHLQTEGQLSRLIQLLEELKDSDLWIDGCCKVILYCVQFKHLSSAVDLLKQLVDKFCDDEVATEFGLNLLQAIKEQLDVRPSRKSLDFLLGACASAKDLQSSNLIWKEMYQALLASGAHASATKMLNKMPKDDPHVQCVIKACKATYIKPASGTGKKKKKNKKEMARE
ncbi:hypothetical protein C3L33_09911, partial [Rhododendron williamsianum]